MIENERQYRITRAWVERFSQSAQQMALGGDMPDPLIQVALVAQYTSPVEELRGELDAYEALRPGQVASIDAEL